MESDRHVCGEIVTLVSQFIVQHGIDQKFGITPFLISSPGHALLGIFLGDENNNAELANDRFWVAVNFNVPMNPYESTTLWNDEQRQGLADNLQHARTRRQFILPTAYGMEDVSTSHPAVNEGAEMNIEVSRPSNWLDPNWDKPKITVIFDSDAKHNKDKNRQSRSGLNVIRK